VIVEKQTVKRISVFNLGKVKVGELTFKEGSPIAELSSKRRNAQGKTSFIEGLEFVSKGKRGLRQNPVHDDAKKARVEVELTDLVIVSEITFNGTASRRVIPKEGSGITGNEEFIDRIFKGVDLDPEGFKGLSRLEKFRFAMKLTGCQDELDKIDAKRKVVYDQRTLANSRLKDSQAQLDGMARPSADLPEEEIPTSELTNELRRINGLGIKKNAAQGKVDSIEHEYNATLARKNDIELEIEAFEEKIKACKSRLLDVTEKQINLSEKINTARAERDAITVPDTSELDAMIEANKVKNEKIRAAKVYRAKKAENDKNKSEAEAKDKEYQALADKKIEVVKANEIQIPGLSLDYQTETLMYNNRDIDSASYAESILIASEMIASMNPDCPFFVIKNAASIGDEIRKQVVDMCLAKGAQGIFESISESELPGLIFVDGVGEVYEGKSEGQNDLFGENA